jgi:hypothetical protein
MTKCAMVTTLVGAFLFLPLAACVTLYGDDRQPLENALILGWTWPLATMSDEDEEPVVAPVVGPESRLR